MTVEIGKHTIGDRAPVFIVAELSANHRGSYELAEKSVYAAHKAGADAIKIQTYTADTITLNCDSELFRLPENTKWAGKTLYELYQEAYTPWEWHEGLQKVAHSLGLEFFSTPFDHSSVNFLEKLDVPAYKIASFEIFDIPLIKKVARTGKPLIISTGMATEEEIREAVTAAVDEGNGNLILLKCTSAYPATLEAANIATVPDIKRRFGTLAGLSDHTAGFAGAAAAAALGADMIEKHFILDYSLGGSDAHFSLDKKDFAEMVRVVRDVERATGYPSYDIAPEARSMRLFARSLFIAEDIKEGELFTEKNLRSVRPGGGLHPRHLEEVLGRRAACNLTKGSPMSWEFVL